MKSMSDIRKHLLHDEENLSAYAQKSSQSAGRQFPITPDPFRLEFARDETRIIHSPPFRRLKHKTQVFLSPDNDHICTRMEHVLHVSSIASVIGRCLNLNTDLINAIAKAHDLGHPPFGHAGEQVLDEILQEMGVVSGFKHEMHGLRVVDKLTNYGSGLNLTFEVRDGIITHCGEKFERSVIPDRTRDVREIEAIEDRTFHSATLEGCVVRMVDRIAYLGRDLEDGIQAGLVKRSDVPAPIAHSLGTDNGKIIGRLVNDAIANSLDVDAIQLSEEMFELMMMLKEFNYERIYRHPLVSRMAEKTSRILRELFSSSMEILQKSDWGRNKKYVDTIVLDAPTLSILFDFIKNTNYNEQTPPWRIVTDYVAGMTDVFAMRSYSQLFLPSPVV
ncbi:MAG: HD domain-containing protein [Chitinivibrionales bacterium]